ncbi:MAG: helix-turn-helix domain-containing protein [Nitrososphaerales archaeon]
MLDEKLEEFGKIIADLKAFGLTPLQAKIYLSLLAFGPMSAPKIAKLVNIHRADAYKKLKELINFGIISHQLGMPNIYVAESPFIATKMLIKRFEYNLKELRQRRKEILKLIPFIQKSRNVDELNKEPFFRLVIGREHCYSLARKLIREAKREVLRVISNRGLKRNIKGGLFDEEVRAAKRGVKITIITNISENNIEEAILYSKFVNLRSSESINMRFSLIDESILFLGCAGNDKEMSLNTKDDIHLLTTDPTLINIMKWVFEYLLSNLLCGLIL